MIRVVVTGDVSDWNIAGFSIAHIPATIRETIADADLFVPNLEGPIHREGPYPRFTLTGYQVTGRLLELALRVIGKAQPKVFSTPAILDLLCLGKGNCVVLANNHIRDLGAKGVADTLALLRQRGIQPVGAGADRREANAPARLDVNGKPFVVLNYNFVGLRRGGLFINIFGATRRGHGAAYLRPQAIRRRIRELRAETPTAFILLVAHAGRSLARSVEATGVPYQIFEQLGADCVVCHHSHRFFGSVTPRSFVVGDFVFRHPGTGGLPEERQGGFVELFVDRQTNRYEALLHTYTFRNGYPSSETVETRPSVRLQQSSADRVLDRSGGKTT